jgi:Tol biopolymer transport system component
MGITRDGVFHYARRAGGADVYTAEVDWVAGKLRSAPRAVAGGTRGGNCVPAWSPDGALLAWLSRTGTENFGRDSRVITISDGRQERTVAPKLAHLDEVRWAPDGMRLLVDGVDRHGRRGVFEVDPSSNDAVRTREDRRAAARGGKSAFHEEGKVYVRDADGAEPRLLATVRHAEIDTLEWLPDGGGLLMGTTGKTRRLWRVSLEGGAPQPLTFAVERSGPVSVNPVDGRIAYTSGREWTEVRALRLPAK